MFYFSRKPVQVEIVDKEKKETGINALLNKLSSSLQAILGASTILYALGYLCWMLYAWDNHLGMLPAIKEQYFIAGFIPAAILIVVLFILQGLTWVRKKLSEYRPGKFMQKIIRGSQYAMMILIFVFAIGKSLPESVKTILLICIAVSFVLSTFFSGGHGWLITLVKVYVIIFGIAVFALALSYVFPFVPSAFGGPKQTLVQFDILKTQLSPQTYLLIHKMIEKDSLITGKDSTLHNLPEIIRSDSLYLLFE